MGWSLQQGVRQCVIQIIQCCLFLQNDIQTFEAINGVRKKYCLHTPVLFTHSTIQFCHIFCDEWFYCTVPT